MRLYGKKFASRYIQKKLRPTSETSDGIIFEIDWSEYICKCKIQGSNEFVNAHFPRNEATIPSWLKPGNAVRLLHRAGIRGHTEVIGHGGAIPTPQPGSPSHPQVSDLADGVLTGLETTAADDDDMAIAISAGTYRINSITYSVSGGETGYALMDESDPEMTMNETFPPADLGDPNGANYVVMDESDSPMTMSETWPDGVLGIGDSLFILDAAPAAGWFRYDTFQAGIDETIDYVKGTAATSNPVKPAISTDHIQIGEYILVIGGRTEITNGDIGLEWTTPHAVELTLTGIDDFPWDFGTDYPETNITVAVQDQYGNGYADPRTFTLTLTSGTGQIWSADSGYDSDPVSQQSSSGGYSFKYQRDQTEEETSPSFIVQASGSEGLLAAYNLILYDEYGVEVTRSETAPGYQIISSSGGAASIDWGVKLNAQITLTEDVTFTFTGDIYTSDKLTLLIVQDGTGGWEITLPAGVKYGAEITAETVSTAINSRSYLGFIYYAPNASYDLVANVSGYYG